MNQNLRFEENQIIESAEQSNSEEILTRLVRQLITAQEDERKRIARDLHDVVGQQVTALKLNLELLKEKFGTADPDLRQHIEKTQIIADQVDREIDFYTWELRPTVLDDLGLVKAAETYVNEWSRHFQIAAEFGSMGLDNRRFASEIEINLYRIVQEALNNVAKHAAAEQVSVLLERVENNLVLIIEDDGKGFDLAEKSKITRDNRGMGLLGMRERAILIGGSLEIETARGKGTTIYVRIPASL